MPLSLCPQPQAHPEWSPGSLSYTRPSKSKPTGSQTGDMSPQQPLWVQMRDRVLWLPSSAGRAAHEIKWLQNLPSFLEAQSPIQCPSHLRKGQISILLSWATIWASGSESGWLLMAEINQTPRPL